MPWRKPWGNVIRPENSWYWRTQETQVRQNEVNCPFSYCLTSMLNIKFQRELVTQNKSWSKWRKCRKNIWQQELWSTNFLLPFLLTSSDVCKANDVTVLSDEIYARLDFNNSQMHGPSEFFEEINSMLYCVKQQLAIYPVHGNTDNCKQGWSSHCRYSLQLCSYTVFFRPLSTNTRALQQV